MAVKETRKARGYWTGVFLALEVEIEAAGGKRRWCSEGEGHLAFRSSRDDWGNVRIFSLGSKAVLQNIYGLVVDVEVLVLLKGFKFIDSLRHLDDVSIGVACRSVIPWLAL